MDLRRDENGGWSVWSLWINAKLWADYVQGNFWKNYRHTMVNLQWKLEIAKNSLEIA